MKMRGNIQYCGMGDMLEIQVQPELSEWGGWGPLSEKLFLVSAEWYGNNVMKLAYLDDQHYSQAVWKMLWIGLPSLSCKNENDR